MATGMTKATWRMAVVIVGLTVIAAVSIAVLKHGSGGPKYQPTHEQSLEMQVAYKDAQIAQIAARQAEAELQHRLDDLRAAMEKVKKDNGWPDSVKDDLNNMLFCDTMVINTKTQSLQCPTADVPLPAPTPAPAPPTKPQGKSKGK